MIKLSDGVEQPARHSVATCYGCLASTLHIWPSSLFQAVGVLAMMDLVDISFSNKIGANCVPADIWTRIFGMLVQDQPNSLSVLPWLTVCRMWHVSTTPL
jgi:hypothetical protein